MKKTSRVASRIVELRKLAGISQMDLADRAGIPFRSYQRIESGEASPRLELIFRILKALNASPTETFIGLFNEDSTDSPDPSFHVVPGSYHAWSNQSNSEPFNISLSEIEGLKRALSGDYERGISKVGYWEWNLTSRQFYWSTQMYDIYGMEIHEDFDYQKYKSLIKPEDLAQIDQDLEKLIKLEIPYCNTHRVSGPNGEFKVKGTAKKYRNSHNEIIIFGIAERVQE